MRRLPDHRRKRKTAPAGTKGGSKHESKNRNIECGDYSSPKSPAATPANLISVKDACERSGEKPAAIINWCVRHKIGSHIKAGKAGNGGDWMVDPDRLQELLSEREVAAR